MAATDICSVGKLIEILSEQDPEARVVISEGPGLVQSVVAYHRFNLVTDEGVMPMLVLFPNPQYQPVDGFVGNGDPEVTTI